MYSGTYSISMHTMYMVQYTHTSYKSNSHKSRQLVSLRDSQKSLRSHWSRESSQSHMHTHTYSRWEYRLMRVQYSICEHKRILLHKPPVNIHTNRFKNRHGALLYLLFSSHTVFFFFTQTQTHTPWPVKGLSSQNCHAFTLLYWFTCLYNYMAAILEKLHFHSTKFRNKVLLVGLPQLKLSLSNELNSERHNKMQHIHIMYCICIIHNEW